MPQNNTPSMVAAGVRATYAKHPLCAATTMTATQYQDLKDSIETIGPMTPVVIADGQVLDGWDVYRACIELDMQFQVQELPAHVSAQDYLDAQSITRKVSPSSAKHQRIPLNLLRASSQPRPITPSDVDELAASIRAVGLISPITVRPAIVMGNIAKDGFQIVAGHHRVAAARALGWTEIDAIVVHTENRLQAELIEIDENLIRSELTTPQKAHYTARRKEIWEALHPEPSPDYSLESYDDEGGEIQPRQIVAPEIGYKKPPPQTKGFAASTAEVTGENVRQIQRNLARAEAIGPDILKLSGTSLETGVELDALAKLSEPERKDLIERAQTGEKVTARTVSVVPPPPSSAPPDPWDTVEKGSFTLPEGMTEEDFGPSEEEKAALEAEYQLVIKLMEADDKTKAIFEEAKRLKAEVELLTRRRDEYQNKAAAAQKAAMRFEAQNRRLLKELAALKKGGAR